MNNSKTATQKHMTLDDRISIEKGLDQHLSLRSIALQFGSLTVEYQEKYLQVL